MSDDNYYKVGGSLEYQHPTYVVRQADTDLYDGLTNGDFCYVLNSRQMGKSSLRVQMMKKLKEQGFKCASIDMTRIGSHVTPAEWYAGVVSELLRGFGLAKKVNFSSWWRDREMLPPLQRLSELIEDVLLAESSQKLVIFIDEIDSIIKIKFKEDFFAFIRACYNQRVDNPEYNRLTFCLLGVATPSDLIEDRNLSTPFNIGRAIELTGFQLHEATPLAQGLTGKTSDSQALMREVLAWTGGQPFLTQKVCKLILNAEGTIPEGNEAVWVENLVRSRLIENWETQDEPEHLRTVRDRIIWSPRKGQLLQLYQQILQSSLAPSYQGGDGGVKAKDTPKHMELRLSGLVVKQQGKLRVYNRIYASVFNKTWVENGLAEAGSLPEVAAETPAPSKAEIQALEKAAFDALQQFEFQQIEALISAMQAGQALKVLVEDGYSRLAPHSTKLLSWFQQAIKVIREDGCPLQDYPTVSPLYALQTILDNIYERNKFQAHQRGVNGVSFSSDGQHLATAGADGMIGLWNLSGQQIVKWRAHIAPVLSVSFSSDGQRLATSGLSGNIRLWNLSGQELTVMPWNYSIWSVSFSPDGQRLATVDQDGTARIWNLSEQQLASWSSRYGRGRSVDLSLDGQPLATASEDGIVQLCDLSRRQLVQWDGYQDWVTDISISPNGQQIAIVSRHGKANLWNLSVQQLAQFNRYHYRPSVRRVSFSSDGQRLATAKEDGTTRLRNLSGQQLAQLNTPQSSVRSMSFSPNGKYLAIAGSDGTVRLWDLSVKHQAQWHSHQHRVRSVSFSPDGQYLATAGADSSIRLWNLQGNQLAQFEGHQGWVRRVSFSPDGQHLATAGDDGTVRLWNLQGQQIILNGRLGRVNICFSPDGQRLATAGDDGTVRFWSLQGQQLSQLSNHQCRVDSVSFSPDGQRLATAGADGKVRLWNLEGQLLLEFRGHRGWVYSMSFSPDGQYLATGGTGGTVRLWNLSGHQLAQWQSHKGLVYFISFHPNGQQIATTGADSMAKVWDLSGRQLAQWQSPNNSVFGTVSFSPDGRCLAAAGTGGLQIWRIGGLDELLARGCDWLKDYFVTHPEALEKLKVCQNRFKSTEAGKNLARAGDAEEAISDRAATLKEQPTSLSQQDEEHAIAKFPSSAQTSQPTSKRILWVDDKPANIAEEIARLQEKGIEVTQALSTAQAMQILLSSGLSFDAIITDMGRTEDGEYQPEAGILFIKAIRKAGINLPILVYTTLGLYARTINEVVAAGGNGATMSAEELSAWLRDYTNLATKGDREDSLDKAIPKEIDNLPSSASVVCNELISERVIDYTRLHDLLAAGQWKEADQETAVVMLKVSSKEEEGWLTIEDLEKFPSVDLNTINQLWVRYSNGRFGFSVQKRIWQEVGGSQIGDYETEKRLGERLGWRVNGSWVIYLNLTFSLNAPIGHLPGCWFFGASGLKMGWDAGVSLLKRQCIEG